MAQPQRPDYRFLEVRRSDTGLELELTGEWRALRFAEIDAALASVDLAGVRRIEIRADRIQALDLTGAWRLHEFIRQARCTPILVDFVYFLGQNKKWWLLPILVILVLLSVLMLLSQSAAAPFIYTLF